MLGMEVHILNQEMIIITLQHTTVLHYFIYILCSKASLKKQDVECF